MLNTTDDNPKVPAFLQFVTAVECVVVFSTAFVLFFLPELGRDLWAWGPPLFNSRNIGAIYFAALAPLVIFAVTGRWVPGRLVLWMIFAFTTAIMLAMLVHNADFDWTRWATYAFWFLYLFLPINSAIYLYRLRDLPLADSSPPSAAWQSVLTWGSLALGLYGIVLYLVPEWAASFWPWPVDGFHGRIYTATYFTPAVGAWLLRKRGAAYEFFTLGLTLFLLGAVSTGGVFITNPAVPVERQVDFTRFGPWLFLLMNLAFVSFGGALMWRWNRHTHFAARHAAKITAS